MRLRLSSGGLPVCWLSRRQKGGERTEEEEGNEGIGVGGRTGHNRARLGRKQQLGQSWEEVETCHLRRNAISSLLVLYTTIRYNQIQLSLLATFFLLFSFLLLLFLVCFNASFHHRHLKPMRMREDKSNK